MRRFFALFAVFVLILSTATISVSATDFSEDIIDLGDGFYMVETVSSYSLCRSGDKVYGNKSGNVYQGSTLVGVATLYASFDISGTTAKAIYAQIDGTGYNGGSYTGGSSNYSRNTASGTAYFSYNGIDKTVRLSISCSPDGTLS